MNTDFRVSVDYFQHHKTMKLERRLGDAAPKYHLRLLAYAAKNRPDGDLCGMDGEDIEIAVGWPGEREVFTRTLREVGLLDQREGDHYIIHDWKSHNSWAAGAESRSDEGRYSRMAKVRPDVFAVVKALGKDKISKSEWPKLTGLPPNPTQTSVRNSFDEPLTAVNAQLTPAPVPALAPITDPVCSIEMKEKNLSPDNSPESAPPRQKPKREIPETYLSFAQKFQDEVSRRFPTLAPKVTKALVESGAETIDKLIRLDGFSLEDIRKVLLWAISDEFWSKQVRSLACLRKVSDSNGLTKFQNIQAKMQDATGPQAQRNGAKPMAMNGFTPGSSRYPREEDIPVDHYRF